MKYTLKSSFFAVVIAGAMTTQVISMEPLEAPTSPAPVVNQHQHNNLEAFSTMAKDELDIFVAKHGWHELQADVRRAIFERIGELKAAAQQAGNAIKAQEEKNKDKAEDYKVPQAIVDKHNQPDPLLLTEHKHHHLRRSGLSRFDEWCDHARANKLLTAGVIAGVALGGDLLYAYHTKSTPQASKIMVLAKNFY